MGSVNLLEAWDAIEKEIPGQFSAEAAAIRAALTPEPNGREVADAWALIEEELENEWTGVDTDPASEMRAAVQTVRAALAKRYPL